MQIDWTTLVLEIINFLVLVWILKRFLYRPVMEAIAARQQRVEGKLAEARAIEDGARELQQQYQRRLADWDMEKAKVRAALDTELLLQAAASHEALVTVEDGAIMGGAGSAVAEALAAAGVVKPLLQLGLPDQFIEHGDPARLLALEGLDATGIEGAVRRRFGALVGAAVELRAVSGQN